MREHQEIGGVRLTGRERQILGHVLRFASYKKIGEALGISDRTAEVHVHNLAKKIDSGSSLPAYKRVAAWATRYLLPAAPDLQPA